MTDGNGMSLCECGHDRDEHMQSRFTGCLVPGASILGYCHCLTYTPVNESETAMTNDNLPRVIEFEDIQPGDTIETSRKLKGITFTAQAVAAYLADEEWCTAEDCCITYRSEVRTIRLLDRPKPPLPTEGFIEAWGTLAHGKEEVHLVVAMLVGDGDWYGFTEGGGNSYLRPSQITRWRAVTVAPKADDGLRGRLEKLLGELDARPAIMSTNAVAARKIRAALTDGAEQ